MSQLPPDWMQEMDEDEEVIHRYCRDRYTDHDACQVLYAVGNHKFGYPAGSFFTALIELALKADRQNLVRLARGGWSVLVAVYDFRYGLGEAALLHKATSPRVPS